MHTDERAGMVKARLLQLYTKFSILNLVRTMVELNLELWRLDHKL